MIIVTEISIVLVGILLLAGTVQHVATRGKINRDNYLLDCAIFAMKQEQIRMEKQLAIKQEEDRLQKSKVFYMDLRVTHGSAFGGFCATMNDGRHKKGSIKLDQIMLFGKHPTGKEFTYYIEDQNLEICATDDKDVYLVRSTDESKFEIRQNGQSKDEGESVESAFIRKNIQYFIILESKHEISLKALKGC